MELYIYKSEWAAVDAILVVASNRERAQELGEDYAGVGFPKSAGDMESPQIFWLRADHEHAERNPKVVSVKKLIKCMVELGADVTDVRSLKIKAADGQVLDHQIGACLGDWARLPEGVVKGYSVVGFRE